MQHFKNPAIEILSVSINYLLGLEGRQSQCNYRERDELDAHLIYWPVATRNRNEWKKEKEACTLQWYKLTAE